MGKKDKAHTIRAEEAPREGQRVDRHRLGDVRRKIAHEQEKVSYLYDFSISCLPEVRMLMCTLFPAR